MKEWDWTRRIALIDFQPNGVKGCTIALRVSNNNDKKLIFVKNKCGKTVGIPTKQRALML
jgi:hypothetical protein